MKEKVVEGQKEKEEEEKVSRRLGEATLVPVCMQKGKIVKTYHSNVGTYCERRVGNAGCGISINAGRYHRNNILVKQRRQWGQRRNMEENHVGNAGSNVQ